MPRTITMIPARMARNASMPINEKKKRRVAAYARVSTDNEEQLTSYEAQVDYYTKYIKNHTDWDFVEVYTDEGISATNTKHRNGFKRMVDDALNGKIDLIITKSVSRFARNTVDSLVTVRELKTNGVEVYFEKENIYTFDGKGELLITIMSSLAQEESRSISENVTWGCRKRFADGKVSIPYGSFLGYERGEDGQPQIVEKEAKIVRLIYKLFLEGKTASYIARYLTSENIPTPKGRSKWSTSTVESILKNEKYKGSALLQKTFTTDFLTKSKKVNEGEIPQYYVEDSHPAIVSKEVYDLAQMEFEKRRNSRHYKTTASCFSGMIFCGDCGGLFGSKVWHSNDKYRRVIWQCNSKFKNERKCTTPHLREDTIKQAFLKVFNEMLDCKDEVVESINTVIIQLSDTSMLDKKINSEKQKLFKRLNAMSDYIELNKRTIIEQEEYNKKFDALSEDCKNQEAVVKQLEQEKMKLVDRRKRCVSYLNILKQSEMLHEFSEEMFYSLVDRIDVYNKKLEFTFKNEMTMDYELI